MKISYKQYCLCFLLSCMYAHSGNLRAQSNSPTALNYLDVNNIKVGLLNGGDWGWDLISSPVCQMPKVTNPDSPKRSTIFCGGLWMGGMQNGKLHIAASTYRQRPGVDFFAGPVDTTSGNISKADAASYDSIWKVGKTDIDNFKNGTGRLMPAMQSWPGNPFSSTGEHFSAHLAPYVDANANGVYDINTSDPSKSDYPKINGGQEAWWIFNDVGNVHGETGGYPLGVEVHARAFAYPCSDSVLNNSWFFQYNIINRSPNEYDSFYIGNFTDFDIGYVFDDYIGCDTLLNAFYGYNGAHRDPGPIGYGNNPPAQAVVFLDMPMTNFMTYNNDYTVIGNPTDSLHYYEYLGGKWQDGEYIHNDGKNGRSAGPRSHFMYPGDPVSGTGWTEISANNPPGDRRGLASTGPFTFKPGEVKPLTFAYIFTRRPGAGAIGNVGQMKKDIAHIRSLYSGAITSPCFDLTGIAENTIPELKFDIYPNPATHELHIIPGTPGRYYIRIINMLGKEVFVSGMKASDNYTIELPVLPAGMYNVLLQSSSGSGAQKLIIE